MRLKDTKQKIYDVAVELFATKGYRLTTIKDIAEKVGIKPSSIYNYFNTKEEILNYIIKNFPDTYIIHIFNNKRPEELYKKGKVVLKNIANIFKLISYNNHTNLLFRIMIQELLTNDKLREVYHEELYQKSVKRLSVIFFLMMEDNMIEKSDPYLLANEFLAPLFFYQLQIARLKAENRPTSQMATFFEKHTNFFWKKIRKRKLKMAEAEEVYVRL